MKLARLDAQGELIAIEDVSPPEWIEGPDAVPVPEDTDLVPGRARWDAGRKTFHVRPPAGQGGPLQPIDGEALTAIALGFLALRARGEKFPARTQAWLDAWAASMDAAGLVNRKGDPL